MSGNTNRLFERKAHGVVGNRVHVADDFGGEASVVFEAGGDVVDVEFGFDDRLAGVAAFEFCERGQVRANFFGETEEDAAALLRRCGRLRAFFEGGLGGGDSAVHIVGGGVGDLGDCFFGGGIVYGEGL